jgi:hypothetical protein
MTVPAPGTGIACLQKPAPMQKLRDQLARAGNPKLPETGNPAAQPLTPVPDMRKAGGKPALHPLPHILV